MPMVPEFHGNVPQVRDNGGSSFSPATLQQSNFDYGKVLTEAMKPVTDFADSATETLKVMHARTVKAESDDAEQSVVEIINTYMNDPDNGYLAKQGKNAMDGYQGAVEGMQKDIDKVIGGLQPTVREAIQSRLEDRMTMAMTKANQWRATQTQQYHLQSSKSREAMLFDDAAKHYADTDYLNKTWAAIELEIDFQTQNLGLPPETIKQLKKQKYSLFQAQRFQAWAEKDPVGALMNFRGFKGDIDLDVKSKISKSLFSQAQGLLAYDLALSPLYSNDENDFRQEDYSTKYNTKLTDAEEKEFQKWAKENNREKDVFDYDLRGAWKEIQLGSMSEDERGHLGDKYKKPNHPTFSTQSIYNGVDGKVGGTWSTKNGQTVFTPGKKLTKSEEAFLKQYFNEVEPEVMLNSSLVETWLDNPLAPTGNAFIDSLPRDERLAVTIKAQSMFKAGNAEKKQQLTIDGQNAIVEAATTGTVTNPLTLDQYVSVYGPKDGEKEYKAHVETVNMNVDMFTFKGLSNTDIDSIVKASKPEAGSANYAEEYKRYETRLKAAAEIKKQRTSDPVQFAIENEMNGYKPLDLSNESAMKDQLLKRCYNMKEISSQWGVNQRLFSKSEASALVSALDGLDVQGRTALLTNIFKIVGKEGARAFIGQMKDGATQYAIAMSAMGEMGESGLSIGQKYLIGKDAEKTGLVKPNDKVKGEIAKRLGATYRDGKVDVEGVFNTGNKAFETTVDLAMGIYNWASLNGSSSIDAAVEEAIGGKIVEHNGRKTILPNGVDGSAWFATDFEDLLESMGREYAKGNHFYKIKGKEGSYSSQWFGQSLPNFSLIAQERTEDGFGVVYQVFSQGFPVVDLTTNRNVLITVRKPTKPTPKGND